MHIDKKFLEFMPVLFLIWPCFPLVRNIADKAIKITRSIFRQNATEIPIIVSKSDVNKFAYETILPTVESSIRNMNSIKFIILLFILLFFVAPFLGIISEKTDNGLYLVVIPVCLVILLRYIKCYFLITNNSISITSDRITFPVFGLLKPVNRDILFSDIKDSVMYGSRENVEMTLNEDIDQGVEDLISSGSVFMQGICIWDAKGKYYIFSNKLISAEILSTMYKKLPGDTGQFISEFN